MNSDLKLNTSALIPYRFKNKWGYVNEDEKIEIECKYDECDIFIDGLARIKKDGKYGYIDISGQIIIDCIYDELRKFNKVGISVGKKNEKYGCINRDGVEIIPFDYPWINSDMSSVILFMKDDKWWGALDFSGILLIPAEYLLIVDFIFNDELFFICNIQDGKNIRKLLLNKNGEKVSDIYDDIRYPKNGLLKVENNAKYGAIDIDGKLIIPFDYDFLQEFDLQTAVAKKDNKFGIIDIKNKTILDFEYDRIDRLSDKYPVDIIKDNKVGLVNHLGEIVFEIDIEYQGLYYRSLTKEHKNNLIRIKANDKFGCIDVNKNLVIPFEYDFLGEFKDGLIIVKKNNLYGCLNSKGEIVLPIEYDHIDNNFENGYAIVTKNNFKGVINFSQDILIPIIYENLERFGNELFIVQDKKKKKGLIDKNNIQIQKCVFSKIGDPDCNFWKSPYDLISIGKKQGLIDLNGKIIIECKYKNIWKADHNLLLITQEDGSKGYIDLKGNEYWID